MILSPKPYHFRCTKIWQYRYQNIITTIVTKILYFEINIQQCENSNFSTIQLQPHYLASRHSSQSAIGGSTTFRNCFYLICQLQVWLCRGLSTIKGCSLQALYYLEGQGNICISFFGSFFAKKYLLQAVTYNKHLHKYQYLHSLKDFKTAIFYYMRPINTYDFFNKKCVYFIVVQVYFSKLLWYSWARIK